MTAGFKFAVSDGALTKSCLQHCPRWHRLVAAQTGDRRGPATGHQPPRPAVPRRNTGERRGERAAAGGGTECRTGPNDVAVSVANTHGWVLTVSGTPLPPTRPARTSWRASRLCGELLVAGDPSGQDPDHAQRIPRARAAWWSSTRPGPSRSTGRRSVTAAATASAHDVARRGRQRHPPRPPTTDGGQACVNSQRAAWTATAAGRQRAQP